MKIANGERQFIEAARLYGLRMKKHEFAATKAEYDRIVGALRALRKSRDQGEGFLLSCLSDPTPRS